MGLTLFRYFKLSIKKGICFFPFGHWALNHFRAFYAKHRSLKKMLIAIIRCKKYEIFSVKSLQSQKNIFRVITYLQQETAEIKAFNYYDNQGNLQVISAVQVNLPNAYSALIKNACILPHSSFVMLDKKNLYYDYVENAQKRGLFTKHFYSGLTPKRSAFTQKKTKVCLPKRALTKLTQGISLLEDYQSNYYHWLLEVIPKLQLIENIPELNAYPLLVPKNLSAQFYEILECYNVGNREIIYLEQNQLHQVEDLVYLSNLSLTDEVHLSKSGPDHYCISPLAVQYLRSKSQCKSTPAAKAKRLIYLARYSAHRKMLNDQNVEAVAKSFGFEIINCNDLSFKDQIKIFAEADFVLGPTGASFTNIAFCPVYAQGLVLFPGSDYDNFYIFQSIASHIKMKLDFFQGTPVDKKFIHSDFNVNIKALEKILTQYQYAKSD